jgi:hypothetical protein
MSINKPIYGTPNATIETCRQPDIPKFCKEAASQVNYYNRRMLDIMTQVSKVNSLDDRTVVIERVELLKGEIALKVKLATDAAAATVANRK